MKKSNIFFLAGCTLIVIAAVFVWFALNHPEGSFPWGNGITDIIYIVYIAAIIAMFVFWKKTKK